MRAIIFTLLATVSLLTGCSTTREPFTYTYPPKSDHVTNVVSLIVLPAKDLRAKTNELDQVLFIPSGLDEIVIHEMESTGKFAKVVKADQQAPDNGFLLEANLLELNWDIPNHGQMEGTAFGLSLLTGGVGGIIYGSTKTTVYGHAQIAFKFSNLASNHIILEKQYSGEATNVVAKFNCDTPATGRRIAGEAVKVIIDQFKHDLSRALLDQ